MAEKTYYPELAEACGRKYRLLIDLIRDTARAHGYAIGVHGSLNRDIDLIAAPWIEDAADSIVLRDALVAALRANEHSDIAFINPKTEDVRAHGRSLWAIHVGDGVYLDLSIMPKLPARSLPPQGETAPADGGVG